MAIEGAAGPVLEWPTGWDAQSLAEHRRLVVLHFRLLGQITADEQAATRNVFRALLGGP